MAWLSGALKPKVSLAAAIPASQPAVDVVTVREISVPRVEPATGSIRAVRQSSIAAEVLARVVAVNVQAGQHVRKDEVLVRLDEEEFAAKLREAEAVVTAAQASRDQMKVEYDRVFGLHRQNAAADIELQRADTALKDAEARLEQAQQSRRAAARNLESTEIRAPFDAVIVDRFVEVGDVVSPQRMVVELYDPTRMQLVANVRDSLVTRIKVGQSLDVYVEPLDRTCGGTISEIVPKSDVASRSFMVKVVGPCSPEIHAGMFGRLMIPLDDESWIVIPRSVVKRVGQLDLVYVRGDDGAVTRRIVVLGRSRGDDVEVLSGLRAGEAVVRPGA